MILRNISVAEIEFVMKEVPSQCIGKEIRIRFDDFTYDASFALNAVLVRIAAIQTDTFVVGCKFKYSYPVIEKYIAAKQTMIKKYKDTSQ